MSKVWEFFDNLNEIVYVSDVDSYEMIYMNKKGLKNFGVESVEKLAEKKCYDLFHNFSVPCSVCVNDGLISGYFKEWSHYHSGLDKYFLIKDTIIEDNGKRYHMEIIIDTGVQDYRNNALSKYKCLETIVNEGIRIAMHEPSPDKSIDIILEYIGKALNGERTYIVEKNKSGGDDNTYEWVAEGITPQIDNLQNLPPEICASWYHDFKENKNIVIDNIENIKDIDPLKYEILKRQNIHSVVVVPLYDDNKLIGFYGVDNPPVHNLDYASDMLQIMGHFIISTLRRRDSIKHLREMSCSDQLTKIGNRYAMNEFISNMRQEENIGVIYCDITGLKRVNDSEGHEAGDRLICTCCDCIKKAVGDYRLFRIGGDEFLALCVQIDEQELNKRVEILRRESAEKSVVIATGAVWSRNGTSDVHKIISDAEKLMYEDKSAYYKKSGIDRRK